MWQWLDGKKVIIGVICFLVADILTKAIYPHLTVVPEWLKAAQDILSYFADLFGGVGLLHKAVKSDSGQKVISAVGLQKKDGE